MVLSAFTGFVLGIATGSFFQAGMISLLSSALVILVVFSYKYFSPQQAHYFLFVSAVFLVGFTLGLFRMSFSDLYDSSELDRFAGKKIVAEGVVVSEPDVRKNNTRLIVKLESIYDNEKQFSVSEKILLIVSSYPEYSYGDKLKINVKLVRPENFSTSNNPSVERVFDYVGYLRVRGIWYTGRYAEINILSSNNGNTVKSLLFKTKKIFTDSINNVLPEPESSLLSGLLLGSKQSLGKDLLLEFQKTGVSHIVVLSGYNIAIVADSIIEFFGFLPKIFAFGFGALGIVLFTILSGAGASGWRAAIMVLVALVAKNTNRDYMASRVLGLTIIIMLAPNPLLLIFDPSFQLSVLATVGLIYVSPVVSKYFFFVTEKFKIREIVSTTVATQITVLPLLIYSTGIFSVVSLPVNVLILGSIPSAMFFGFVTGLVGLVSFYLSFIPALFTYIILWYQLNVVHIGAGLSFSVFSLPTFSPVILVFVYFAIFLFIVNQKKQ